MMKAADTSPEEEMTANSSTGDSSRQDAIAARNRHQSRLRSITVAAGAAGLLATAGVAVALPAGHTSSAHATAQHSAGSSGSSSHSSSGSSGSSGSSSSGSSSASSGGLSTGSAPASSSGSGQVTSGGS